MKKLSAVSKGKKAVEVLNREGRLNVRGITSRGIFLDCEDGWTLFVSDENFKGPLTINVPELSKARRLIEMGKGGFCDRSRIRLEKVEVDISEVPVWDYIPFGVESRRALRIVRQSEHPVLRSLLSQGDFLTPLDAKLQQRISLVAEAVGRGDFEGVVNGAEEILGLGSGLTPEGDDYLLGLIYYLRIAINKPELDTKINLMIGSIASLAAKKTTSLSANLIACAAEGLVDERISQVADAFHTETNLKTSVDRLMTWGNTSGRMVLAGMLSGILALSD